MLTRVINVSAVTRHQRLGSMTSSVASTGDPENGAVHLRLIWPQWQGAGSPSVHALAPEFAFEVARRGYAVGATVLAAVLPPHDGPTATVPVSMSDDGLEERDGVEARPRSRRCSTSPIGI